MAQAIGQFSSANQPESELFTFDFVNDLTPGDSILASPAPVWGLTVAVGSDPNAQMYRLFGLPTLSGTRVTQAAGGFLPGVRYVMTCVVSTASGLKLELWAYLDGQVVGC